MKTKLKNLSKQHVVMKRSAGRTDKFIKDKSVHSYARIGDIPVTV